MSKTSTVSEWALPWDDPTSTTAPAEPALVLVWSLERPECSGQTARIDRKRVLGRDEVDDALLFCRERPAGDGLPEPVTDSRVSRRQLVLEPLEDGAIRVENVGKCPLFVNGVRTTSAVVRPGDTLTLQNALVLLATVKSRPLPLRGYPVRLAFPFGAADAHGIVGESPAVWLLRDQLAVAALSGNHVLLLGGSGSGKELAARAVHALSRRAKGAFVTRNAATFPEGLIDAELFGNVKNYPHAGLPERAGLVGEADGGTLFLDEIGELPASLQAHLLRLLDRGGEYHRLGDEKASRADLAIVAATNRPETDLKHDFVARFVSRLRIPSLDERREDVPLLVRHLALEARRRDPSLARFFEDRRDGPELRIDPVLVEELVRHRYTHDVRELERLLWTALSTSQGTFVAVTPATCEALSAGDEKSDEPSSKPSATTPEPTREDVEAALARAGGNVTHAARELRLGSRYALYRLMKKLGVRD